MSERQSVEIPCYEILAQLARDDPAAYEKWRREVIEHFIESTPAHLQRRLRGIQFRVECLRRGSRSALGATVKIYSLMWNSFIVLNDEWQELVQGSASSADGRKSLPSRRSGCEKTAQVIEFRKKPSPVEERARQS